MALNPASLLLAPLFIGSLTAKTKPNILLAAGYETARFGKFLQ